MDTSNIVAATDILGRRSGPRRQYTIAEKRRVAEETLQAGASVALVAQRYGINANLVFGWRRLHQQGLLAESAAKAPPLLPVKVATPTLVPTERAKATMARASERAERGSIEIELASGQRVRIRGRVDRATLSQVIDVLSRR